MKSSNISSVVLVWMTLVSAESTIVDQIVHDFPILDTTGTHWIIYDVTDPQNRWTDEDDLGALTIQFGTGIIWIADVGLNLPLPAPAPGDTLVIVGSWDSAYVNSPGTYEDNVNHTGFYWLFSDTLDDLASNSWRDDTLRSLPWPAVAHGWGDSIEASIKNPAETRYPGQTVYDVAGFDLWLDTTCTGTPNSFDVHIGFFPIMDGPGHYTLIKWWPADHLPPGTYDTYHAYYLVVAPTFASDQDSGHMTYYLSENSNYLWLDVGIAEHESTEPTLFALYAIPSIVGDRTAINYALPTTTLVTISIYTASGQLVSTLIDEVKQVGEHSVMFDGSELPSGVYFYQLEASDRKLTEKLLLLR